MSEDLPDLLKEYKDRKSRALETLRSLGIPEKMLKGKSLDELEVLLDRYGAEVR